MIDVILRRIAARLWRRRRSEHAKQLVRVLALPPNKCMYCAYRRWANEKQGMRLKLEPHHCVEGNSPPGELERSHT